MYDVYCTMYSVQCVQLEVKAEWPIGVWSIWSISTDNIKCHCSTATMIYNEYAMNNCTVYMQYKL